ncbi:MAG: hypothetical protein E6Q97_30895 [Desulfurellales bacterium]|nr:MAG: hypothetical protein E6Q97_30895 [Desulfurellales bacterium]
MTEETQTQYQDVSDEFDFSAPVDELPFEVWVTITTSEVRRKPEFNGNRKSDGTPFTVPAHDALVIWGRPDGRDKDWNLVDAKMPKIVDGVLNKNSVVGDIVFRSKEAGITFKNPKELEGRKFLARKVEHKKFGSQESNAYFYFVAEDKGAAGVVSAQTASAPASIDWDRFGAQVVDLLDGHEANSGALVSAVTASDLKGELTILTAAASGALLREAQARGLVEVVAGKIQKAA